MWALAPPTELEVSRVGTMLCPLFSVPLDGQTPSPLVLTTEVWAKVSLEHRQVTAKKGYSLKSNPLWHNIGQALLHDSTISSRSR